MDTEKMYIDGQWVLSESGKTQVITDPSTGNVIAAAAAADVADTRRAVDAAYNAFASWRRTTPAQRAALLVKAAECVERRAEEIAAAECRCSGRLLKFCRSDVAVVCKAFRFFAGIADLPSGLTFNGVQDITTINIREPLGVCAMIVPWNGPINIASKCIAPALAAGNTIVIKPSSLTPLGTVKVVECMEEAGFPKGVVNLVLGAGSVVGSELGANPKVAKVTLTGGTDTGKDMIRASAANVKKLSLELGGKSAVIIFEDADIDAAIDNIMFVLYASAGQVCVAGTRILVIDEIYDRFVAELVRRVSSIRVGPADDEGTQMGPVISKRQLERVLKYIDIGIQEGARLAAGGHVLSVPGAEGGYYIEPTVFADCKNDMRIAQEEIFGPVLAVERFYSEQEAYDLANDTVYGLGAGIYTRDSGRTWRFAKEVKAACMWVNTYGQSAGWGSPISCTKQSGYSTLLGVEGLEAYTDMKQVSIRTDPAKYGWFDA